MASTTVTIAVVNAPMTLRALFARHPDSRSRLSLVAIPYWESVKERKTPTAYRGSSEWVSPPNTTISSPARIDRRRMPFEKTSRSPTL